MQLDKIMVNLKIYKTHPDIVIPKYQTEASCCFDLAYNPAGKKEITFYSIHNDKNVKSSNYADQVLFIGPGERVLVPTGLIFDIPLGYSVRVHPRSGTALKLGLNLINGEGVIDADYVEECFLPLINNSRAVVTINKGDRLAQAELIQTLNVNIVEILDKPQQKTDRNGGFGSTGK